MACAYTLHLPGGNENKNLPVRDLRAEFYLLFDAIVNEWVYLLLQMVFMFFSLP